MKKLITSILLAMLLGSCITDPYMLKGSGAEKYYLSDIIGDLENRGFLSPRPAVVIDSIIFRPDIELKEHPLPITKQEIITLKIIQKKDIESLKMYNLESYKGAIIITTSNSKNE